MFDEQPDGDPHGECTAEINRLRDLLRESHKNSKRYLTLAKYHLSLDTRSDYEIVTCRTIDELNVVVDKIAKELK